MSNNDRNFNSQALRRQLDSTKENYDSTRDTLEHYADKMDPEILSNTLESQVNREEQIKDIKNILRDK